MERFIKKITKFFSLTVLLFAIIWINLLIFPNNWSSSSFSITNNIKNHIESVKNNEILIIGDSRAVAGFNPKIIDSNKVYNLNLGGATPITGYFTLKKLLNSGKTPKLLIVSYAPFHLIEDDSYPRIIKEDFLNFNEISELYDEINSENDVFWRKDEFNYHKYNLVNRYKAYLLKIKFPIFFSAEIKNSKFLRKSENLKMAYDIKNQMGFFTYGKKDFSDLNNQEVELNTFNINKTISKYLTKLFRLANDNNIKLIYINTPFNEASKLNLNNSFLNNYEKKFNLYKKEFPEVIFYSQIYSYENKYFGDPSHLNKNGSKKFSNYVKGIIEHNKY